MRTPRWLIWMIPAVVTAIVVLLAAGSGGDGGSAVPAKLASRRIDARAPLRAPLPTIVRPRWTAGERLDYDLSVMTAVDGELALTAARPHRLALSRNGGGRFEVRVLVAGDAATTLAVRFAHRPAAEALVAIDREGRIDAIGWPDQIAATDAAAIQIALGAIQLIVPDGAAIAWQAEHSDEGGLRVTSYRREGRRDRAGQVYAAIDREVRDDPATPAALVSTARALLDADGHLAAVEWQGELVVSAAGARVRAIERGDASLIAAVADDEAAARGHAVAAAWALARQTTLADVREEMYRIQPGLVTLGWLERQLSAGADAAVTSLMRARVLARIDDNAPAALFAALDGATLEEARGLLAAIAAVGNDDAQSRLVSIVASGAPALQAIAAALLGEAPRLSAHAEAALGALAADPDHPAFAAASAALGRVATRLARTGDASAIAFLHKQVGNREPAVRRAALAGLAASGDESAADTVRRAARADEDPETRAAALGHLRDLLDNAGAATLHEAAQRDASGAVRMHALLALRDQAGAPEVRALLERLVSADPDVEVRQLAEQMLVE